MSIHEKYSVKKNMIRFIVHGMINAYLYTDLDANLHLPQ